MIGLWSKFILKIIHRKRIKQLKRKYNATTKEALSYIINKEAKRKSLKYVATSVLVATVIFVVIIIGIVAVILLYINKVTNGSLFGTAASVVSNIVGEYEESEGNRPEQISYTEPKIVRVKEGYKYTTGQLDASNYVSQAVHLAAEIDNKLNVPVWMLWGVVYNESGKNFNEKNLFNEGESANIYTDLMVQYDFGLSQFENRDYRKGKIISTGDMIGPFQISADYYASWCRICDSDVLEAAGGYNDTSITNRGSIGSPIYYPDVAWGIMMYFKENKNTYDNYYIKSLGADRFNSVSNAEKDILRVMGHCIFYHGGYDGASYAMENNIMLEYYMDFAEKYVNEPELFDVIQEKTSWYNNDSTVEAICNILDPDGQKGYYEGYIGYADREGVIDSYANDWIYAPKVVYWGNRLFKEAVLSTGGSVEDNYIEIGGNWESLETPWDVNSGNNKSDMLTASLSVVGKVMYVWGGGHTINTITQEGIMPTWLIERNQIVELGYPTHYYTGQGGDINSSYLAYRVAGSPVKETNQNLLRDNAYTSYVRTAQEYISETDYNSVLFNTFKSNVNNGKFTGSIGENGELVTNNYSKSIINFMGMDCSGYVGWVLNQATDTPTSYGISSYRTTHNLKSYNLSNYDYEYKFGDLFDYSGHIVMVVGKVSDKICIFVEETPPCVRLSIGYINGYNDEDFTYAYNIVKEANKLIGNLDSTTGVSITNMKNLTIDRPSKIYDDENMIISKFNKTINELDVIETIQLAIDNMGKEYLWGLESYSGELFKIQ